MPIRGVVLMLVIIVVIAFCFRHELYAWLEDHVFNEDNKDKETKE